MRSIVNLFLLQQSNDSLLILFIMKILEFIFIGSLLIIPSITQAQPLEPGVYRWSIKTSLLTGAPKKETTLDELIYLANPVDLEADVPANSRMTKAVNGFKEGDIITITGWLLLVALEDDSKNHQDGDFHIQIRNGPVWGDSCLVVEIPDSDFVSDPNLKQKCAKAREFVVSRLLNGQQPTTAGNKMTHPAYVTITGQLFFDGTHMNGPPRGKRGMHSYTCWELHPVIAISFAPKPQEN
jgi:hypothetical protein